MLRSDFRSDPKTHSLGVHGDNMQAEFLLDPDVVFLNHGSFGATPRTVFDTYQEFQQQLERDPVRFFQREMPALFHHARRRLAKYLGARAADVVFVPNPTFAINTIVRSLDLKPGDQVLTSNHEYGACRHAWEFMRQKNQFEIVEHEIPLPVASAEEVVDAFWNSVTPNTKVIFLSQITSPTAWELPIEPICRRAREAGIITIIDGAHVPGQRSLDLTELDADFYTAACHKWMCAPKGASFLHVRRDRQKLIEPLVVGWGWGEDRLFDTGNPFQDHHTWLGTRDLAAYLSVPAAIDFQQEHDWPSIQKACHELAVNASRRGAELDGEDPVHRPELFHQMALIDVTNFKVAEDPKSFQQRLYDDFRIEVPVITWSDRRFVRVSVQAYNSAEDVDVLIEALKKCR